MDRPVILFDLDGTLIDSTEAILESFRVAFETFNTPVPHDDKIKNEIGHTLENMFLTLGVDEKHVDAHVHAYKMHYRIISCQKTTLLEGAREAIVEASRFARLGIVTTKTGKYSTILLEYMDLIKYFDVLIGREDVTHPKPHPEPILRALDAFKYKKKSVWMIGDTPMDIISAKSANVNAVAVTSGYASYQELKKYTSTIYDNSLTAINFIKKSDENYK
jgi:phosphoglycolate phosphatase